MMKSFQDFPPSFPPFASVYEESQSLLTSAATTMTNDECKQDLTTKAQRHKVMLIFHSSRLCYFVVRIGFCDAPAGWREGTKAGQTPVCAGAGFLLILVCEFFHSTE
jgi:hypothetical protein